MPLPPIKRSSEIPLTQEPSRQSVRQTQYHFSITNVANSRFQSSQEHQHHTILTQTFSHQDIAYIKFLDELDKLDSSNRINPVKFWFYLSKNRFKLQISFTEEHFQKLVGYTVKNLNRLTGKDLATLALTFVKLNYINPKLLYDLQKVIEINLLNPNFFNGQDITNLATAFSLLGHTCDNFVRILQKAIEIQLPNIPFFNSQNLRNIAWAFASISSTNPKFINCLKKSVAIRQQIPNYFTAKDLNVITEAFFRLDHIILIKERKGDLTSEHMAIINAWLSEIPDESQEEVKRKIIYFLTRKEETMLSFHNDRLSSLPNIFHLAPFITRLKILIIKNNNITDVPTEICNLPELEYLDLSHNNLTALPITISNLRRLKKLDVSFNRNFTALPLQIFQLPLNCSIHLNDTNLSRAVLRRLREATINQDYNGPNILMTMPISRGIKETVYQHLGTLFTFSETEHESFPNLTNNEETTESLRIWLSRLSGTKDYKQSKTLQKALANKILQYLKLANSGPKFHEIFFKLIEGAEETCGDRISLSILHLGLAYKLASIKPNNTIELEDFIIKGSWTIDILDGFARNKIEVIKFENTEKEIKRLGRELTEEEVYEINEDTEEVEIYLGYPIKLQRILQIPIDIQEMLYFSSSSLTEKDLKEAADFVLKKHSNDEECCRFLITQDRWKEALKLKFSDEIERIERSAKNRLEEESPDYKKIQEDKDLSLIKLTKLLRHENLLNKQLSSILSRLKIKE